MKSMNNFVLNEIQLVSEPICTGARKKSATQDSCFVLFGTHGHSQHFYEGWEWEVGGGGDEGCSKSPKGVLSVINIAVRSL